MNGREWTDAEIEFIRANYAKTPTERLAEILKRSGSAVYECARRLGVGKQLDIKEIRHRRAARAEILAYLAASESPVGETTDSIGVALEMKSRRLYAVLEKARQKGAVSFINGGWRDIRYFGTPERMEACREATLADCARVADERKAAAKAKDKEHDRRRMSSDEYRAKKAEWNRITRERKRAALEAAPKVEKKTKKKPPSPVMVHRGPRPAKVVADLPVVVPSHVQIQRLPGFTGDRWQVSIPRDGWSAEWKALRRESAREA